MLWYVECRCADAVPVRVGLSGLYEYYVFSVTLRSHPYRPTVCRKVGDLSRGHTTYYSYSHIIGTHSFSGGSRQMKHCRSTVHFYL